MPFLDKIGAQYLVSKIKAKFNTTPSLVPYGTAIQANANLNSVTYLKVGNYYCSLTATAATLSNNPAGIAFMMEVTSPLSTTIDNESSATWVYRIRKLTTYTGVEYVQEVSSGNTAGSFTYGSWRRTATTDEVVGVSAIQTSVSSASTNSQVPSAKLFYDTVGDIETTLNTIRGVS